MNRLARKVAIEVTEQPKFHRRVAPVGEAVLDASRRVRSKRCLGEVGLR
jgi:hypothetical protein